MKKAFLSLLIALASMTSLAQKYDRAYKVQVGKYDEYNRKWNWSEATDVDLVFTFEGNLVKIDDRNGTKIWTYKDEGEEGAYDDDGDRYTKHTWRAYDENNKKCIFVMVWYKSISLVTYMVFYNDYAFRYYISTSKPDRL